MLGLMQSRPLLISSLLDHAAKAYATTDIVSSLPEGGMLRYTYRDAAVRARQAAKALRHLGVKPADRVATLAWNTHRHLELFFAVPGMGAVMHTVNPRLFLEQIQFIVDQGGASVLVFDSDFADIVQSLPQHCSALKALVCLQDHVHWSEEPSVPVYQYEALLASQDDDFDWPSLDENTASSMCFTSGTTGNPKGVVYSHRSTVLHALVAAHDNGFGITCRDRVLPVAPMFHVNAWALPYVSALAGAGLILPGNCRDPQTMCELIEQHQVTFASAVPTVWKGVLDYLELPENNPVQQRALCSLNRAMIGGTAVPRAMIETLKTDYDVTVLQVWGMTETSPLGVACSPTPALDALSESERQDLLNEKQGRRQYGIEMRIVDADQQPLPEDGVAFGHLQVRGPWVTSSYLGQPVNSALTVDGWFDTGDVATIDEFGFMKITDRSKDVIKSGGEWISSVDLENIASAHEAVALTAAIGVPHPKWDERPLLLVVPKPGRCVLESELLALYQNKVASWWIPNKVMVVDELLFTATGKVDKKRLRERYRDAYAEVVDGA